MVGASDAAPFLEVTNGRVDRVESYTGNIIALRTEGSQWKVANLTADGEIVGSETSISRNHPFTEEEARAEFDRWRVRIVADFRAGPLARGRPRNLKQDRWFGSIKARSRS